jgi:hypothetical protein
MVAISGSTRPAVQVTGNVTGEVQVSRDQWRLMLDVSGIPIVGGRQSKSSNWQIIRFHNYGQTIIDWDRDALMFLLQQR